MTLTPRKLAVRGLVAGLALTAMGLVAATPAAAHTNNLFTYSYAEETEGFSTVDRSTAVPSILAPSSLLEYDQVLGIELFNEVGTAIVYDYQDSDYDPAFVVDWNHSTGASGTPVPITLPGADGITLISGLDTLNDGRLITYIEYVLASNAEVPTLTDHAAIAFIDRTSGVVTPVIDVTDLRYPDGEDDPVYFSSLATDPISGSTFAFLDPDSSSPPLYLPLDIAGTSHGGVTAFSGTGFEAGFVQGADFDHDGTLYFYYGNYLEEEFELSTAPGPATWPNVARHFIGPADGATFEVDNLALTLEHVELAATGSEFASVWLFAGGFAVLAGVVTVVTVRRRKVLA